MAMTTPDGFDIGSISLANDALRSNPLHFYDIVAPRNDPFIRWPYPGGYLPIALLTGTVADLTGLTFGRVHTFVGLGADLLLAYLVQDYLRLRGRSERIRAVAAGCIVLSPLFWVMSGYHGPFDSTAFLPAVAGLIAWERMRTSGAGETRRGLVVGTLIGLSAAIKTIPFVIALALLPSARSSRERAWLLAPALAIPAVSILPFFLATPRTVFDALTYSSAGGFGGPGLFVDPERAYLWPTNSLSPNAPARALDALAVPILMIGLAITLAVLWRKRAAAPIACVAVVLAMYVFGVNFFMHYAIWIVPFLLIAGYIRTAVVLNVAMLAPLAFRYLPSEGVTFLSNRAPVLYIFVPLMMLLWAGFAGGWFAILRKASTAEPAGA